MLRSNLCDYSDAYIVGKGIIFATDTNNDNRRNKKLTFNNNAPFSSHITNINDTVIGNADDLDILCLCIIC